MSDTIFEIVAAAEARLARNGDSRYPSFTVKEKDLSRIAREIREGIPTGRVTGEPVTSTDIETAIRQGRLRISKTTLRM